jgi:hypothetical protein
MIGMFMISFMGRGAGAKTFGERAAANMEPAETPQSTTGLAVWVKPDRKRSTK